jgi:LysR family transcriptional regulator, mexEF-oprN operon transcriptional activator
VFRLGLLDDLEIGLLPALSRHIRAHAPGIGISVRSADFRTIGRQIDNDEIDVAVGVFDDVPKIARRTKALNTSFRVLYDPRQITIGDCLPLERYITLDHVIVSFSGEFYALFEEKFASQGVRRNIVMSSPRFSAIPYVLRESPVIATIPEYLAYRFARSFGLATVAAPYVASSFDIEMAWPLRLDADPGQQWFRQLLQGFMRMNVLLGEP